MYMPDEGNIDDIFEQIKKHQEEKEAKKGDADRVDIPLTRDDLESFLIRSAGGLVRKALDAVDDAQIATTGAVEAEEMEALAGLTNAASAAIDALSKIYITLEKSRATKEIKQLDIDAKLKLNTQDNTTKILMSREEAFKEVFESTEELELVNGSEIIDV